MDNEEHTSILTSEFGNLLDEYNNIVKVLDEDDDGWDIPIGSNFSFPIVQRPCPILNLETITENAIGREPNLDFSSAAEILSKD